MLYSWATLDNSTTTTLCFCSSVSFSALLFPQFCCLPNLKRLFLFVHGRPSTYNIELLAVSYNVCLQSQNIDHSESL